MKQLLRRLMRPTIVAFVVAAILGLSGFNGATTASAAPAAPAIPAVSIPVVTAPAVQLAAQSAPAPAISVAAATVQTVDHKVQKGDTLSGLAACSGVSLATVKADNPQIADANRIFAGRTVVKLRKECDGKPPPQSEHKKRKKDDARQQAHAQADSGHRGASDATWDRLAKCESGGRWDINTGNGFYGGLQFTPSTWREFGGKQFASMAHKASRAEQIIVAERVLAEQGWKAWPVCSRKIGVRPKNR